MRLRTCNYSNATDISKSCEIASVSLLYPHDLKKARKNAWFPTSLPLRLKRVCKQFPRYLGTMPLGSLPQPEHSQRLLDHPLHHLYTYTCQWHAQVKKQCNHYHTFSLQRETLLRLCLLVSTHPLLPLEHIGSFLIWSQVDPDDNFTTFPKSSLVFRLLHD